MLITIAKFKKIYRNYIFWKWLWKQHLQREHVSIYRPSKQFIIEKPLSIYLKPADIKFTLKHAHIHTDGIYI